MKTVLIVDDSNTARMIARRCLEVVGWEGAKFLEAVNGEEALTILRGEPTDLVLTDLNMPAMDGEALLKRVKGSPKTCHIPVVMVSSADNPARERRVLEMGAHAVLGKPLSPGVLKRAICELMENKERWAGAWPTGEEKECSR